MLGLLACLGGNGFKACIVSGGGIEFMRPWAEEVYGIPPVQAIGSNIKTKFEALDEAKAEGWMVADMKNDWNVIFPYKRH